MAIFRINRNTDYTVMSNVHLRDNNLSLKAKGLMSLMLSLPDKWDYSVNGLTKICKEECTAIESALKELKIYGYLIIKKILPNNSLSGRIEYEYNIYEVPQRVEKQGVEFQVVENQGQLNTKQSNTKKENINNIYREDKPKRKRFVPPTLEEVEVYCMERKNNVDAKKFYDYFSASDWVDSKGNKVKSWKQKVITWEGYSSNNSVQKKVGANGIAIDHSKTDLDDLF